MEIKDLENMSKPKLLKFALDILKLKIRRKLTMVEILDKIKNHIQSHPELSEKITSIDLSIKSEKHRGRPKTKTTAAIQSEMPVETDVLNESAQSTMVQVKSVTTKAGTDCYHKSGGIMLGEPKQGESILGENKK
jgi:hypothetical protein